MALKGTAVIELTDVKTGEVERYVEHNLVTKALDYMHRPIGALKSIMTSTTTGDQAFTEMLGGIVLWDKAIEESAEIHSQPRGVGMVGCAAHGNVNTTTSSCRGSYNEAESIYNSVDKSMKFVYDFQTNQANGTINCISLTSKAAGFNGFGGDEQAVDSYDGARNLFYEWSTSYRFRPSDSYNESQLIYIDPDEDVFYWRGAVTTTAVTIQKYRANIKQRSIFTNHYTNHQLLETITVEIPSGLSTVTNPFHKYDVDNNVLYIAFANSVASGGSFKVIAIDMNTLVASLYSVTNPVSASYTPSMDDCCFFDGKMCLLNTSNNQVCICSLEDSTWTKISAGGTVCTYGCSYIDGMVYFMLYPSGSSSWYYRVRVGLFDPLTNTIRVTGLWGILGRHNSDDFYNTVNVVPVKNCPMIFFGYRYYSGQHIGMFRKNNYLGTINNLSRAIEKTSDKTMKITYTIQEM